MRRRKTRTKDLPKIAALSLALIGYVAGLGFATYMTIGKQSPDHNGCFPGIEAPQTFVVVDNSGPRWNEVQERSTRNYFEALYNNLPFTERLSVFTTEGDRVTTGVPKSSFHVCGQADRPEQLADINAPTGNAGYLLKQKERLYERVFKPELDALLTAEQDQIRRQMYQSPMMEMIKALSTRINHGDKLVVISDLIQNSDSMQACRVKGHLPAFSTFRNSRTYLSRLKPESMEGVNVELLMLQRHGYGRGELAYCTEDELRWFWEQYFTNNGVSSINIIRVRHGYAGDT